MTEWLKTTVPGIILLGAVGSIVALFILKALGWIARRLALTAAERFFFFALRPMMTAYLLASRYARSNDLKRLIALSVMVTGGFFLSTGLSVVLIVAVIFYFTTVGPILTPAAFVLVTSTGLILIMWVRDGAALAGIFRTLLERDYKEAKLAFKDKDLALRAYEDFQGELKKPDNPPPPRP